MQIWLIYLIIFLEGYVVLAIELLMMRQLTPYVGNSTDIMAIIIASVLLPLAIGYHRGGHLAPSLSSQDVRFRLSRNFMVSCFFLTAGFLHIHIALFFETLDIAITTNRWIKTALYCGVFAVYPVYLLGQTLPLLSRVLPSDNLSRTTGRMLFYSTIGSFCGSIISTLILMALVGVHNTVNITLAFLVVMVLLLHVGHHHIRRQFAACVLLTYVLFVNNTHVLTKLNIVQNNAYSQVSVHTDDKGTRFFSINRSFSSMIGTGERKYYGYIEFIDRYILQRLAGDQPKSILVIGAGGFTLGRDDLRHTYIYLDIDPDLRTTAETYFLKEPLRQNQIFIAESARSFLDRSNETFDAIVIDAFTNRATIPADLVTEDFFRQVRSRLKPGGVMAANIVTSGTFQSQFSRTIDTTLHSVFPYISRQILYTSGDIDQQANVIYVAYNTQQEAPQRPSYSDLLNRYFWDY